MRASAHPSGQPNLHPRKGGALLSEGARLRASRRRRSGYTRGPMGKGSKLCCTPPQRCSKIPLEASTLCRKRCTSGRDQKAILLTKKLVKYISELGRDPKEGVSAGLC
eukprot:2737342-Prymnesium_polylepis.2